MGTGLFTEQARALLRELGRIQCDIDTYRTDSVAVIQSKETAASKARKSE